MEKVRKNVKSRIPLLIFCEHDKKEIILKSFVEEKGEKICDSVAKVKQ